MDKLQLNELKDRLITSHSILLLGIGFDKRCLTILKNVGLSQFDAIIGIHNLHSKSKNLTHLSQFSALSGSKAKILGSNSKSVVELVDELSNVLHGIESIDSKEIFFDITSLSHEILVVVVGLLNELNLLKNTTFLYTQASKYGSWLSKGVNQIRSVLGFSGLMYPSKKLHLIVLLGFELERAERVIMSYEPAKLTLGMGSKDQSISSELFAENTKTMDEIESLVFSAGLDIENINKFKFSCLDPFVVKSQLLDYINGLENISDYNIIIAPLNNKISTLGVAFASLENQSLQICYAEAEEYNYDNYVEINNLVSIFKFKK